MEIFTSQGGKEDDYNLAGTLDGLSFIYFSTSRYEEAEAMVLRELDLKIRYYGPTHRITATSFNSLGMINHEKKNFEVAEGYFLRVLEIDRESNADESEIGRTLLNLAHSHRPAWQVRVCHNDLS